MEGIGVEAAFPTGDRDLSRWRQSGRCFLELFCLTGFALSQQVLDVFGKAPDVFVFYGATTTDIVLFAVVVAVVPPIALWCVEELVALAGRRSRRVVHLGFLGALVALVTVQLLNQARLTSAPLVVMSAAVSAAATVVAYRRLAVVRQWLAFAAVAPFVFVGLFLLASPVSDLLGEQEVAAAEIEVVRDPVSVVMVVWDEWPLDSIVNASGEIDAELFPNLAALAADGAWYRNATTTATATSYAVPSMLTGRMPEQGSKTGVASEYPENLFTLLASRFDLEVTESVTRLCPRNLCGGDFVDDPQAPDAAEVPEEAGSSASGRDPLRAVLGDAVESYRTIITPGGGRAVVQGFAERTTADTTTTTLDEPTDADTEAAVAAARASGGNDTPGFGGMVGMPTLRLDSIDSLISSIERDEEATLHFLHVQLPHSPYHFLPAGQSYLEPSAGAPGGQGGTPFDPEMMGDIIGNRSTDETKVRYDRQRLIMQVAFTDSLVGEIVDRLKETGLYDSAIVVMTSDHGAAFVPGETIRGFTPGDSIPEAVYADLLYVPLIIKGPGIEAGAVDDSNVMTVDILPTVAEQLGIDLPWPVDGISLLSHTRADGAKEFHKVAMGAPGGPMGASSVGPPIVFDGTVFLGRMLERHIDTTIEADNDRFRLFDVDEAGELVGRTVDDLGVGPSRALAASIDDIEKIEQVDPGSEIVPARVLGRVTAGLGPEQVTLAISLNGRIAAVVRTYGDVIDAHRFEALMVPSFLEEGPNEVALYLVDGDEGERSLSRVAIE